MVRAAMGVGEHRRASVGFCTRCDDEVTVDDTGACMWCGTLTAAAISRAERVVRLGAVCSGCRGRKSRGALRCRRCATKGRLRTQRGRVVSAARSVAGYVCPDCGGAKSYDALRCWRCYSARGGHRGRKHRKGDRTLQKMSEALMREAYGLYESGLSLRAVARRVYPRTRYASVRSCTEGLRSGFRARGWALRDRVEAVRAENRARAERAGLPQCRFVKARGERCERRTGRANGFCWHHDPEVLAGSLADLRARGKRNERSKRG